jgi:hypothetical protein
MSFWKLAQCAWSDTSRLDDLLADRWEPFAVTESHGEATVWLRQETERIAAQVGAPRRQLESEVVQLTRTRTTD